jgi:two-component system response regulator YesN
MGGINVMYNVLLIEDEAQIRAGLRHLIEDIIDGFKVAKEAENGLEAIEWMMSETPDLIVTDIRMKGMNGIELIARVRDRMSGVPIIIISGHSDFEYTKKAIQYKVENYLLKPVDRMEFTQQLMYMKKNLDDSRNEPLRQPAPGAAAKENEKKVIRQVKAIVQANLSEDISLQFIANQVHMNPQYLSFLFKLETEQNFVDYVIGCRMGRAKQLLQDTNLKIFEIAQLSGYDNAKYFMTVFKQHIGVTPTDYREKMPVVV